MTQDNNISNSALDKSSSVPKIIEEFFVFIGDEYQLISDEDSLSELEWFKQNLLLMLQVHWDKLFKQSNLDPTKISERISNEQLEVFYSQVRQKIPDHCFDKHTFELAYSLLKKFIEYQNNNYQTHSTAYDLPLKIEKATIRTTILNLNWVHHGEKTSRINSLVNQHWESNNDYSYFQILGWLIYSAITYAGINHAQTLVTYINSIIKLDNRHPFINYTVISHIRYKNRNYGNEYESNSLYANQQIVMSPMVMCWLIRLDDHLKKSKNDSDVSEVVIDKSLIQKYLLVTLKPLLKPYDIKIPTIPFLLTNSSYIWELIPSVDIDQALTQVLKGKHATVGLQQTTFNILLNQSYKTVQHEYSIDQLVELTIKSDQASFDFGDLNKSLRRQDDDYIDLIRALKVRLHKNYKHQDTSKKSTIKEDLVQLTNKYPELNCQILLRWVLLLVETGNASNMSISKYITAFAYEWLSFTKGQALEYWEAEDFEELYSEILDDMAIKDISYSARLLQRQHNFAQLRYNFPKVDIVEAKTNSKKVRSEWFSPQLFYALIEQLRISVDSIEADMLSLLFILSYRTGMRKKEILGLKFADIEGMQYELPCVVVRPNHYRPIKTDNSIRRVPVYALLKPNELELFNNFIKTAKTKNRQRFIFTLSTSRQPLDDHVPLKLLNWLHADISKNSDDKITRLNFHGFRHTAITNLSLVLNGHPDLVKNLTDYDDEDIKRIKSGLLGCEREVAQDKWYSCAHVVGHLSPDRSFEYYNHVAWLMATYELAQADIKLPFNTFNNITRISKKRLVENGHNIKYSVKLNSIRKLLFKEILNRQFRKSPDFNIMNNLDYIKTRNTGTISTDNNKRLLKSYGLARIINFLEAVADGTEPHDSASDFSIAIADANQYVENAKQVHSLKTIRGKKRFFRDEISTLTPAPLQSKREQRIVGQFFNKANHIRAKDDERFAEFIMIASSKINMREASINFPRKSIDQALSFLNTGTKLIESKHWLIKANMKNLDLFKAKVCGNDSLKFESSESVNGINIGIYNSNNKPNSKSKYEFSALLRYVVHMVLILWGDG